MASVRAFGNFANAQRDMAEQIGKNADRLNMTTKDLQTFRFAMEQAGESSETADKTLIKFARAIDDARNGVTTALDEFDRLEISLRNTDGTLKGQTQLLFEVADAWSRNDDAVRKIGSANLLFGRTGKVMINMLSQGSEALEHQRFAFHRSGAAIRDNYIRNAEDATDALNRMGHTMRGNATRMTSLLDPAIISVSESLDRLKGIDPIKTMSVKRLHDEYNRLDVVVAGLANSLKETTFWQKIGFADSKEEIKQEIQGHLKVMNQLKAQAELRKKQASAAKKVQQVSNKNKDEEVKNIFEITKEQQKMYASTITLAFDAQAKRKKATEDQVKKQQDLREQIIDFRRTEEQQVTHDIMEEHNRRLGIIQEYNVASGQLATQENSLTIALRKQTVQKLKALDIEKRDSAISTSKDMIRSMGSANKSWFQANKALAIADTTMATYTAATKALAIPPPWVGMAYAATIVGLGLANVNRIRKEKYQERAMGGTVQSGRPYIVGEKGAEIFTPGQTGSITPNDQMGGKNVTFNILANDTRGFDQLLQQRRGMIVSMLNNHMSSNGLPSIETVGRMATSYAQR